MSPRTTGAVWIVVLVLSCLAACGDGSDGDTYRPVDVTRNVPILVTMSALPDTGITKCYDNEKEIACPGPGEPFYGQDAQYSTNSMDFRDNPGGTVTDNVTGLIWQKNDDDMGRNWDEARAYCDSLTLGGYSDWRLPDEKELQSIAHYGKYNPAILQRYFPGTQPSLYWSASSFASYPAFAWYVGYGFGAVRSLSKEEIKLVEGVIEIGSNYVRCVRGRQAQRSLSANGDGTVADNISGLVWQQQGDGVPRSWEQALRYCEDLTLAGHSDWRLPDCKELRSIVETSKFDPAIDPVFTDARSAPYWSSSTFAYDPSQAWYVNFETGALLTDGKGSEAYVRCVR